MQNYTILLTGAIGYGTLLFLALQKFFNNYGKHLHANMIKNFALVIASLFLSIYYYKQAIYNLDDKNEINQRNIKILGHAFYVINILLSLHPQITTTLKIFDLFGILGHSCLVYSAYYYSNHLLGLILLIVYFSYKLIYYSTFSNLEIFTSLILLINYISLFVIDYYHENHEKNNKNHKNQNYILENKQL